MLMTGGALLGQKKYADAEPLLLKGHEGMAALESNITPGDKPGVGRALDRLIELDAATGKPEEAAKHQVLHAKFPPSRG